MEIITAALIVIFIAAAYQDHKKREVGDWLTAIAWLLSAYLLNTQMFILVFVGAWLIAEASEQFLKQTLMGFGDVLWIPIFSGLVDSFGGNGPLTTLVSLLVAQIYLWYEINWKRTPVEKMRGSPFVLVLLVFLIFVVGMKAIGI